MAKQLPRDPASELEQALRAAIDDCPDLEGMDERTYIETVREAWGPIEFGLQMRSEELNAEDGDDVPTRPKRLISSDQAVTAPQQHTNPCSDCPFARTALKGWLGGVPLDEWVQRAHSNTVVPCHTISNQQCAGLAIYRRNVCKQVQPPMLLLPADREKVFATPKEFIEHHQADKTCLKKIRKSTTRPPRKTKKR